MTGSNENHEHARKLLAKARIEGIPEVDRSWLDGHLEVCSDCMKEAAAIDGAVNALRVLNVTANPDVVRRTSLAIYRRREEQRLNRERAVPMALAVTTSIVSAVVTTPYVWDVFEWMGRQFAVSSTTWQVAFVMWWFLPATGLAAVATLRLAKQKADSSEEAL
jgi:hypothetical protein